VESVYSDITATDKENLFLCS